MPYEALGPCGVTCQEGTTESSGRGVQKAEEVTNLEQESGKGWCSRTGLSWTSRPSPRLRSPPPRLLSGHEFRRLTRISTPSSRRSPTCHDALLAHGAWFKGDPEGISPKTQPRILERASALLFQLTWDRRDTNAKPTTAVTIVLFGGKLTLGKC